MARAEISGTITITTQGRRKVTTINVAEVTGDWIDRQTFTRKLAKAIRNAAK